MTYLNHSEEQIQFNYLSKTSPFWVSVGAFSEDEAEISSNKSRGCQELKADENGSVLIKKKKSRLKKRCH